MSDGRRVASLCIVALLALAIGLWLGRARSVETTKPPMAQPTSSVAPAATASTPSRPPLPPADLPLAARFGALSAASRAGDAEASLALAEALRQCLWLAHFDDRVAASRLDTEGPQPSPSIHINESQTIEAAQSRADALRAPCAGYERPSWKLASDYLALAASQGSRAAMREYGFQPMLSHPGIAATDAERWHAWRDDAPKYLETLADEGDAQAALALGVAGLGDACGRGAVPDSTCEALDYSTYLAHRDDVRAYRYLYLDALLGDATNASWIEPTLAALAGSLDASDVAAAEAWADSVAQRNAAR